MAKPDHQRHHLEFFLGEVVILSYIVERKWSYLLANWAMITMLILGLPFVWSVSPITDILFYFNYFPPFDVLGALRFFLIIWLLLPWFDVCRSNLSDNKLTSTLLTAFIIMLMAGVLMSGIDPDIKSPLDGIWWAWVTASTVGYGDIVPSSGLGKLFASLLILMGLAIFAVLTANFSAFFVQQGVNKSVEEFKKEGEDIRAILQNIKAVKRDEDDILHTLRAVEKRLERLERTLKLKR